MAGSDKFADRGDHLDWFFQHAADADESLLTFSTPVEIPTPAEFPATRLPDHRARYLDYDGEIADDRGTVQRLVIGRYRRVDQHDERFTFEVESVRVVAGGEFTESLVRAIKGRTTFVY